MFFFAMHILCAHNMLSNGKEFKKNITQGALFHRFHVSTFFVSSELLFSLLLNQQRNTDNENVVKFAQKLFVLTLTS